MSECIMFRIISKTVGSPSQNVLNYDLKKSNVVPNLVTLVLKDANEITKLSRGCAANHRLRTIF